jgi:hypothetical protein
MFGCWSVFSILVSLLHGASYQDHWISDRGVQQWCIWGREIYHHSCVQWYRATLRQTAISETISYDWKQRSTVLFVCASLNPPIHIEKPRNWYNVAIIVKAVIWKRKASLLKIFLYINSMLSLFYRFKFKCDWYITWVGLSLSLCLWCCHYVGSIHQTGVWYELERVWKWSWQSKVLSQHLLGGTGNHKKSQLGLPLSQPRFELITSPVQV